METCRLNLNISTNWAAPITCFLNLHSQVRQEMGQDISGACGQLVVDYSKPASVIAAATQAGDIEDIGGALVKPSANRVQLSEPAWLKYADGSIVSSTWLSLAALGLLMFLFRVFSLSGIVF
jgi:hypothetical protein